MGNLIYFLFAVALVAAVFLFILRNQDAARANVQTLRADALEDKLKQLQANTGSRKESLETRTQELTELREKLRDAKKRLHDEKEVHRKQEIEHARAEAEREAQGKIEAARQQAAEAQLEIKRLQAELDMGRGKRRSEPSREVRAERAPADVPATPAIPAAPAAPSKPRELTQVEQDRISLLERQAVKQAERVKQLEEDAKRQQRRAESTDKAYKVAKSDVELARSRMSATEKRLNRTLLELDTLRQRAFRAGLANEIVAAQDAAERADGAPSEAGALPASTSPADVPLTSSEAEAGA